MKRIINLIVDHRIIVIACMLVIAAICGFFTLKVNINTDMTKYLPDNSNMKQGLDIMDEDFASTDDTYTIRVMFKGLKDDQKSTIKDQLLDIKYVDSVDYKANSDDYNKDNHTLYVVNTKYDYGTDQETQIESNISSNFDKYNMEYKNDDTNSSDLPLWIAGLAVVILMIILFAMCGSWFEPFLFIGTVGVAVVINMGTNYFLGSISDTTYSITAMLQLVLSMDYSIILMNRYRQERSLGDAPVAAMKRALRKAFVSITSSSVTTIVGLLVLTLMSFKIGMDLGIVLAKGVLLSLLCIFLMLPGEILIFDKLIAKTSKPVLPIKLEWLATFEYKFRYIITGFFVLLFVGVYILSGHTSMAYTLSEDDPVASVFPKTNTMVMVYRTDGNENDVALANKIEKKDGVKSVTCFSNTLGKKYNCKDLVNAIKDMSNDSDSSESISLDSNTISMFYYDYFKKGKLPSLTMSSFLTFLSDDVVNNDTFSDKIDNDMKDNADKMRQFANRNTLVTNQSANELGRLFDMSSFQINQLLLYYNITNGTKASNKMSLPSFVNFLNNDVAKNKQYSSSFSKKTLSQTKQLASYTNTSNIKKKRSYASMASALDMSSSQTAQVYQLYDMFKNPSTYNVTTEAENQSQSQEQNQGQSSKQYESSSSSESSVNTKSSKTKLSMKEFVDFMLSNKQLSNSLSSNDKAQLTKMQKIMNASIKGSSYSASQMASLLGMKSSQANQIYLLAMYEKGDTSSWAMTPQSFINFLLNDVASSKQYGRKFDSDSKTQLKQAKAMIDAVVSNKKYTAEEMTTLLDGMSDSLKQDDLELLYMYYGGLHDSDKSWKMSIYSLFKFMNSNVLQDSRFSTMMSSNDKSQIRDAWETIEDGANQLVGKKYSRMIINTSLPEESKDTTAFIKSLDNIREHQISGKSYLIGTSAMTYEMQQTFGHEMKMITLITALAIFIVVAIAFKSLLIPLILVLLVQCGVYSTVSIIGLQGYSIYYLALLIVECILMGATIDYAILFTNYYKENATTLNSKEALVHAYNGSIHTILTSGLIMIMVTGIVGYCFTNPTIGQICRTISMGALCAVILILFILPALLSTLNRLIIRRKHI